jgi:adenine-specific DNA-methyltransferase
MMYERLLLMRELLAESGTIFVHVAPPVSHGVKLLLDEVFGPENFRNEIVVSRPISKNLQRQFEAVRALPQGHDVVLWYSRSESARFRPLLVEHKGRDEGYWHRFWSGADRPTMRYRLLGETPTHGQWKWEKSRALEAAANYERYLREAKGRTLAQFWRDTGETLQFIRKSATGTIENWYRPSDTKIADTIWSDVKAYENQKEFATQKHRELLHRVITFASAEGDLVADFFCGSGTTGAVAEKLGRRWIMCDLSKWAIQVTRKRLLQIEGCKPFEILNLGNYERHKLAANGLAGWERYVKFILDLYRAEPVSGFKMLHGKKARASVHVGSVDSPITMREIRETLKEAKGAGVREVHFLGWDFEMGLHDLTKEIEEDYGVKPRLISIPKEALEVKDPAKEQVRFFDLNYLELSHEVKGKKLTVTIKDFIIANLEYIPDEVRDKIRKFSDYIDYWAVDWDYHDDTFHNGWQSFRTRKNPKLETKAIYAYDEPGAYKVLVKVVDIFGNDTTKIIEVRIA